MIKLLCSGALIWLGLGSVCGLADDWVQPTAEELKLTSVPEAPGAAVVCLSLDLRDDDYRSHLRTLYVRLKVLTEKGRDYADVELPDDRGASTIKKIEARTIHSDGTIIPFSGKPYEKMIEKSRHEKHKAKVLTLPDVQVGSILEYRFVLGSDFATIMEPVWTVQLSMFIRRAHYEFMPTQRTIGVATFAYSALLPKGAHVVYEPKKQIYTLDVQNIEPLPDEDFMPPMASVSYRVLFFDTDINSIDEYWKREGVYWSKDTDKFMKSGKLGGIAGQIVSPADTQRQKAQKIYDALMKFENTSLTRERTVAEDKAHGVKTRNAEDVWNAKRGDSNEIAVLFVALARATGLTAYAAQVTDRRESIFVPSFLNPEQLDDYIAIVQLDGKEEFLDPGTRYCPFGQLFWAHASSEGLRQTDHGAELSATPALDYRSTSVFRGADLTVGTDGSVKGTIHIGFTGNRALGWRLMALVTDEQEMRKSLEDAVREELPAGIEVTINHVLSLTDYDKTLMVVMDVSGSIGSRTAKRVFLPATFFEAGSKPMFVQDKRKTPVYLNYPYAVQDTVTVRPPSGTVIQSVPKDAEIECPHGGLYRTTFKQEAGSIRAGRVFVISNALFTTDEYPALREFFQKVNAKDQEQAVLQIGTSQGADASSANK